VRLGMKALAITGGLIGLYLAVAHATGLAKVLSSAGTAGGGVIKDLQGR
jgi:hypothetical protein